MTFLAPLFLAGAAAITLPILFHLIRRTSREKVPFSSLMFLTPTPPRVTRKSRLENILLLILRCAILILLALAFARPFLRSPVLAQSATAKRVVVLVDSSASMRRDTLWADAQARAAEVARKAAAGDELAVAIFDRTLRTIVSFEEWNRTAPSDRAGLAAQRLKPLEATWAGTQLGHAIVGAAEMIDRGGDSTRPAEIVLISDMQEGARLDGLQGFTWPRNATVTVVPMKTRKVTNAGVQVLPEPPASGAGAETVKIRVTNSRESKSELFDVSWAGEQGAARSDASAVKPGGTTNRPGVAAGKAAVYVAPGQSRTVELAKPAAARQVKLAGDDADFDNSGWFVPPRREQLTVLYTGADAPTDPQLPLFYLERAFPETARESIHVVPVKSGELSLVKSNVALIVVTGRLEPATATQVAERARSGATVLWAISSGADAEVLNALAGTRLSVTEGADSRYAMLGEIDFRHPLFAPFADARFSDFTKIHFWKRRKIEFEPSQTARVVARFDDGAPALAQFTLGKGTVFALASGWQPSESQLALSSKFVPLLYAMLEFGGSIKARTLAFQVGDPVELGPAMADERVTVRKPDGKTSEVPAGQRSFVETDLPGVYTILASRQGGTADSPASNASAPLEFAVNLAPEESRTAAMPIEELQKLGVPLNATMASAPERAAHKAAALKAAELESRQRLWRWLIAATLLILMVETWIAARISRRAITAVGT